MLACMRASKTPRWQGITGLTTEQQLRAYALDLARADAALADPMVIRPTPIDLARPDNSTVWDDIVTGASQYYQWISTGESAST